MVKLMNHTNINKEEMNTGNHDQINQIEKEELSDDKINYRKYIPYFFLFVILLFFSVFSITYSIYKGNDNENSEIITDQIIFTYSDVDKIGNGINIVNAVPITDEVGKAMIGKNQYFDFYVTSSTRNHKVLYQLLVNKDQISTLSNNNVRIYLTNVQGSYESPLVLTDFSSLELKTINNKSYYVLYEKILSEKLENYSDSYRLRMWVKETAKDYENQTFSIKIDVFAQQVEE